MKATWIIIILGLTVCISGFAAENSDQAAIDKLQTQIAAISTQTQSALAAQQAVSQKAIADLQSQVQTQLSQMQKQIQQIETQLTGEIKQVQTEAVKSDSAPVVTATPGPVDGTPTPVK